MGSEWKVRGSPLYKECGYAEEIPARTIKISRDLWIVICAMLHKFKEHEWQLMLTGTVTQDGCYCDGYIVPKQEVGAATVRHKDEITVDDIRTKSIVAGIHSHVNMGTTPSGTDIDDSVCSPIDYHVIVNNSKQVNGMVKVVLPCGGMYVGDAEVEIEGETNYDDVKIDGIENISKIEYQGYFHNEFGTANPHKISNVGFGCPNMYNHKDEVEYGQLMDDFRSNYE